MKHIVRGALIGGLGHQIILGFNQINLGLNLGDSEEYSK